MNFLSIIVKENLKDNNYLKHLTYSKPPYRICKGSVKNEGLSVTDVAILSGFNDVAYFIREFKKVGVSPREYCK